MECGGRGGRGVLRPLGLGLGFSRSVGGDGTIFCPLRFSAPNNHIGVGGSTAHLINNRIMGIRSLNWSPLSSFSSLFFFLKMVYLYMVALIYSFIGQWQGIDAARAYSSFTPTADVLLVPRLDLSLPNDLRVDTLCVTSINYLLHPTPRLLSWRRSWTRES